MSTHPTRRERQRAATVEEIHSVARRLLIAGGVADVSLRAIAREMDRTAAALYRYYPSLDALVAGLATQLLDELREEVEAAGAAQPTPLPKLMAMIRAFRGWAVTNPAEFGLLFGNPVPGVQALEDAAHHQLDHAGRRFGEAFLRTFAAVGVPAGIPLPQLSPADTALFRQQHPAGLPEPLIGFFLASWTRLYGVVAMEVFGHLRWAIADTSALFEAELAAFSALLRPPSSGD